MKGKHKNIICFKIIEMFIIVLISLCLSKLLNNNIFISLTILGLLVIKTYVVSEYKLCINYSREMMRYTSILNIFELIGTILICIGINEEPISEYNIVSILFLVFFTVISYFFIFLNYDQTIYNCVFNKKKKC